MTSVCTEPKMNADERLNAELDQMLNEALMQTFPCSDPISISVPRADRVHRAHDVISMAQSDGEHPPPDAEKD